MTFSVLLFLNLVVTSVNFLVRLRTPVLTIIYWVQFHLPNKYDILLKDIKHGCLDNRIINISENTQFTYAPRSPINISIRIIYFDRNLGITCRYLWVSFPDLGGILISFQIWMPWYPLLIPRQGYLW